MSNQLSHSSRVGMGYAIGANFMWGVFPLFWKFLQDVSGAQILAHRIIWSSLFFVMVLLIREGRSVFHHWKSVRPHFWGLALSAGVVTLNWFMYLVAVNTGRVLQSSLGYFMSPIGSVLLGTLVLKEKLSGIQKISLFLAVVGVFQLSLLGKEFPFLSLGLAITFSIYGFIRKKIPVDPILASALETSLIAVPSLLFLIYLYTIQKSQTPTHFQFGLLVLSGVITAVPLIFYTQAIKRLPLTLLGFIQYLSPCLQFLLAIYLYSEPFTEIHARGFLCIWAALGLFSLDLVKKLKPALVKAS